MDREVEWLKIGDKVDALRFDCEILRGRIDRMERTIYIQKLWICAFMLSVVLSIYTRML